MIDNLEEELRKLEKERIRLEEKKQDLQSRLQAENEAEKKLQGLFEESGYPTPRALVLALMRKYNVRVTGASTETGGRRKRTKVTAQLRDDVRKAVDGGLSKNQASKQFEVSYLVVNKIINGAYDNL